MIKLRTFRPKFYLTRVKHISSQSQRQSQSRIDNVSKTNIKLNYLPISATLTSLKSVLKDINFRRIELEPGCVLHFCNEAEAEFCKNELSKLDVGKHANIDARISTTVVPSLLIKNCPSKLHPDTFIKDFKDLAPVNYIYYSTKEVLIVTKSACDVLKINNLLSTLKSSDGLNHIESRIIKLPNDTYSISIPLPSDETPVEEFKNHLLSAVSSEQVLSVSVNDKRNTSMITIQPGYNDKLTIANATNIIEKHNIEHKIRFISRPALILRNIDNNQNGALMKAIKGLNVENIQNISSKDTTKGSVILHFSSEKLAIDAMAVLRGNNGFKNKKITVSYKEISVYAVKLSNLKNIPNLSNDDIMKVVHSFVKDATVTFENDTLLIQFLSSEEAERITKALQGKFKLAFEMVQCDYVGIECFSVSNTQIQTIVEELKANDIKVLSTNVETNRSLSIGFLSINDANMAKKIYFDKLLQTRNNDYNTADISYMTAYALEIFGLSPDVSVKSVIESLQLNYKILKADRCAMLKVKRHLEIVPTIKKLKSIIFEGSKLSPVRYYPLSSMDTSNVTDYDNFENPDDETFDKFSLKKLLKDYLHTDPATRYHIAKNAFERQLADANGAKEIEILLDDSISNQARDEAKFILNNKLEIVDERIVPNEYTERLFELYLQRDDMSTFLGDFKDYEASLGEIDEKDDLSWSKFKLATSDDIDKYTEAENEANLQKRKNLNSKFTNLSEVVVEGENPDEDDTTVSLENADILRDREGRSWSGVIVDTDTVQKPMPGNKVLSHRALVVVGNFSGSGGFGFGKSDNVNDALKAAFRDALRNLIHIDLYENYGLAHNVHGKHNSCHAYIIATPRDRLMVGSPLSAAILECVGISSASIKIIGRRNPYSVVRAIFSALQKHENIDETAKSRGLRYLTIKSAFQNNA